MATQTYGVPQQRRKKATTYGKSSRSVNAWSTSKFDALDDDDGPRPVHAPARPSTVKDVFPVDKSDILPLSIKRTAGASDPQDPWDVPTEDEQHFAPSQKRRAPAKLSIKQNTVKRADEAEMRLASWEKNRTGAERPLQEKSSLSHKREAAKVDQQLHSELAHAIASHTVRSDLTDEKPVQDVVSRESLSDTAKSQSAGALARLRAKRVHSNGADTHSPNKAESTPSIAGKRHPPSNNDQRSLVSKRLRLAGVAHNDTTGDVLMGDDSTPLRSTSSSTYDNQSSTPVDDFAMSASGSDDQTMHQNRANGYVRNHAQKRTSKPKTILGSKLKSPASRLPQTSPSIRSSPDHKVQRPAKAEMESKINSSSSPSIRSPTPQEESIDSHDNGEQNPAALTPRQTQIWSQLLPQPDSQPTPGHLAMKDLKISSVLKPSAPMHPSLVSKLNSSKKRTRLIDRMRATAPESESESAESGDESEDDKHGSDATRDNMTGVQFDQENRVVRSQTQSQPIASASVGPKITYAKSRSYLKDDLEDDLMFELHPSTPQRMGKTGSQRSAFDVDDSDEDTTTGRLRSIHELRAGGGNQRFMDETSGLLDDIANHNMSGRSRRRSAMIEMATKLFEKAFAEKFIRQGFEQRLLAECGHASDDVANLALSSALVVLMANDPPEHVVLAIKQQDVISWYGRWLPQRSTVRRMIKDRKYNIAQASQTAHADFFQQLSSSQVVWGEAHVNDALTPRIIALKGLDQCIGRLRRLGDRTELVDSQLLVQILSPHDASGNDDKRVDMTLEMSLEISTLESLSSSAELTTWPAEVLTYLGEILLSLHQRHEVSSEAATAISRTRHAYFLLLRLLLNLTNEKPENCVRLATSHTISILLHIIQANFARIQEDNTGTTATNSFDLDTTLDGSSDASEVDDAAETQRKINLDMLVLALGIMINLAEQDGGARSLSASSSLPAPPESILPPSSPDDPLVVVASKLHPLDALVDVFRRGQQRTLEADSEAASALNVAHGYLAVMLANLCGDYDETVDAPASTAAAAASEGRSPAAKRIAARLGGDLQTLVAAVEEFIVYHEKVDRLMAREGGEGRVDGPDGGEVWSAFTEKLRGVLGRLRRVAGET